MVQILARPEGFNVVPFRLAAALGLVPEGAKSVNLDLDELLERAADQLEGRQIDTLEQIEHLPRGTVLLCAVSEVFWLAPAWGEGAERLWYAAGYPPESRWTDVQVLDWRPLTVLHVGTFPADGSPDVEEQPTKERD